MSCCGARQATEEIKAFICPALVDDHGHAVMRLSMGRLLDTLLANMDAGVWVCVFGGGEGVCVCGRGGVNTLGAVEYNSVTTSTCAQSVQCSCAHTHICTRTQGCDNSKTRMRAPTGPKRPYGKVTCTHLAQECGGSRTATTHSHYPHKDTHCNVTEHTQACHITV